MKIVITLPQALHDGAYVLSGILLSDDGAVLARTSEQTFTVAKSAAPVPAPSLEWLSRASIAASRCSLAGRRVCSPLAMLTRAGLPEFDFGMGSKNGEDGILEALARRFGLWNGDKYATAVVGAVLLALPE